MTRRAVSRLALRSSSGSCTLSSWSLLLEGSWASGCTRRNKQTPSNDSTNTSPRPPNEFLQERARKWPVDEGGSLKWTWELKWLTTRKDLVTLFTNLFDGVPLCIHCLSCAIKICHNVHQFYENLELSKKAWRCQILNFYDVIWFYCIVTTENWSWCALEFLNCLWFILTQWWHSGL